MISCAPRLKKDNGPTWKSVSIHWTDSDMNRLMPVDGLPWIRTTDKAKLFNKNGPLRVVATYRTTDGVDPKTEYRHVSMIADAIEQYVLVKITMPEEVSAKPGADWPKFRVWAFLQPPIIGRDKKRRDANGGYVVDDIPRAGWFEAVVDGKTMTAEEIDYSKGHKSPAGKKPLKVTGERDASDPRVVRFKICARVANNESEAELKEKAQKLRKKNQDVSLVEAGSYLKVWVRNEERTWPQKPLDDDSEKIVQSMADADSIKPGAGTDPRKFRNHTWKRSRLATHKNIAKGKEPDKNLLYVGLYPAYVIEKMEQVEKELKAPPKKVEMGAPREFSFANWFAVMAVYCGVVYGLRKARDARAKSKDKNGQVRGKVNATKFILAWAEGLSLQDLFAAYAVAGLAELPKVAEAFKEAERHPDAAKITKQIAKMIMELFLEYDIENQAAAALEAAEDKNKSGLKKFKPGSLFQAGINWKEQTGSVGFNLIDDKDKDFGPWPKMPRPLPGYLAWLGFQTKLTIAGRLPVSLVVDGSAWGTPEQKTVIKVASQGKEKGKLDIKFPIMIRALWSYAADAAVEKMKEKGKTPILDTFKDVLEYVDIELTLTPSLANEFSFGWGGEWTKVSFKPESMAAINSFLSKLSTAIHAQASVFEWNYDPISGNLLNGGTDFGIYFDNMSAFGADLSNLRGTWGVSKFDLNSYLESSISEQKDEQRTVVLGERFGFHLGYASVKDSNKTTFSITYRDKTNVIAVLSADLSVVDVAPKGGVGRGEVKHITKFSWSDSMQADEGGGGYFRNHYQKNRAELVKFLGDLASKDTIAIIPEFKVPPTSRPTGRLSKNSSLVVKKPVIKDYSAVLKSGAAPELIWMFEAQNYLDSHIWVQLKEHDTIERDDVISLKGEAKNNWKLMKISGGSVKNGKLMISIPVSEIAKIEDKENNYQFYLRLGLLDDDSCEIHTSKQMIAVPKAVLKGVG